MCLFLCPDSSDLQSYLNTSVDVSCNFNLEKYACTEVTVGSRNCQIFRSHHRENNPLFTGKCTQLESFTANQLASLMRCDLPGNSSRSRILWKLLLTHLSSVLDPTLDILANVVSGFLSLSSTA